ncbi:MAG: FadR family transcriptional regulator [Candidatus Rokubacteria bacterium]|nr:FadR family transcriptional regulator [Candidatus Rokubacteria bacterium]MBI3108945.1 FadR family transcriptional regulator [Candidatus Rokubacteria bacterium]
MFTSVRGRRLAQEIAGQVREAILSGKLSSGARLPSERELAETFGASPLVVREALHSLEIAGLLGIRAGAGGGAVVARPDARPVTESLSTMLRLGRTTVHELTQARLMLEPEIARLVARSIARDQLAKLEENVEAAKALLGSGKEARLSNLEFHKLLAGFTGNQFIALCVESVVDTLEVNALQTTLPVTVVRRTLNHHRALLRALGMHDSSLAASTMRRHIIDIQRALEAKSKGTV